MIQKQMDMFLTHQLNNFLQKLKRESVERLKKMEIDIYQEI